VADKRSIIHPIKPFEVSGGDCVLLKYDDTVDLHEFARNMTWEDKLIYFPQIIKQGLQGTYCAEYAVKAVTYYHVL
jgi:hypothetical protein